MNYRGCYAHVDLNHLRQNFRRIQELLGEGKFLCPMVKADAYGHGDVQIAKALESNFKLNFGVSLIEEGLKLRQAGVSSPILVFGIGNEEGHRAAIEHKLTPVISSYWQLEMLSRMSKSDVAIHLKVDTGMNRMGLHSDEIEKATALLGKNKNLKLEGLLTHLYRSDDTDQSGGDTQKQLQRFEKIAKAFALPSTKLHALNSGALLKKSKLNKDHFIHQLGSRPGLLLYGVSPFGQEVAPDPFKPVMSVRSCIVRFHNVKAGETVSYSGTWQAKKDSVVGVVAAGYADGFHRILSNKGHVLFRGKQVPVVGNVCMDFFLLDLTEMASQGELKIFEEVTLFGFDSSGNRLAVEDQAFKASTIAWEMLTSVSARVPRVYQ